jgi:hypothetical protein
MVCLFFSIQFVVAWCFSPSGDRSTLGGALTHYFSEMRRGSAYEANSQVVRERLEARNRVVHQLLLGDISLTEALDRFTDLEENEPNASDERSREELAARRLRNWLRSLRPDLKHEPRWERVVRLEAELDRHLTQQWGATS